MSARARLWLDLALFGALFLAYNPAWTRIAVHEWLSVIIIVPLLFHVIVNWDQTLAIMRRFAEIVRATPKVNLVVDAALFVAGVTVMLSGLFVSQYVLRAVGRQRDADGAVGEHSPVVGGRDHPPAAGALRPALALDRDRGRQARSAARAGARERSCRRRPPGYSPPGVASGSARRRRCSTPPSPPGTTTATGPEPVLTRFETDLSRRRTMKNLSRNTVAVLVVTLFTGLAVFSAIQLGGRLFGTPSASAQTISAQATQTQTSNGNGYSQSTDQYGYDQSSEHGELGYDQSSGSQGYSDPYGQSGSSSDTGQTYTCPATGCTASSCHATQ